MHGAGRQHKASVGGHLAEGLDGRARRVKHGVATELAESDRPAVGPGRTTSGRRREQFLLAVLVRVQPVARHEGCKLAPARFLRLCAGGLGGGGAEAPVHPPARGAGVERRAPVAPGSRRGEGLGEVVRIQVVQECSALTRVPSGSPLTRARDGRLELGRRLVAVEEGAGAQRERGEGALRRRLAGMLARLALAREGEEAHGFGSNVVQLA